MLGIKKGKPFAPDASMKAILEWAVKAGRAQMLIAGYASNRSDRFVWPDRKWEYATLRSENGDFDLPTGIDLETRDHLALAHWRYNHDEPTPVCVHRRSEPSVVGARSESVCGNIRSDYQGRTRHRSFGWD